MKKKLNFVEQFKGVEIEYSRQHEGSIQVFVNFKEPGDSNSVMIAITKDCVSISRTLRDGGEFIEEFDHW